MSYLHPSHYIAFMFFADPYLKLLQEVLPLLSTENMELTEVFCFILSLHLRRSSRMERYKFYAI